MTPTSPHRQGKVQHDTAEANGDGDVATFILQVNRSEIPHLMDRLNEALTGVGVEGSLVPAKLSQWSPDGVDDATISAFKRGEALLRKWTQDGTLIDPESVVDAWAISKEQLHSAIKRGDLFVVPVDGKQYFPHEFARFSLADLSRINQALGDADPSRKHIFLMRKHGALNGLTAAEAVEQGQLDDVIRIAHGWAHI